MNRFRKQKKAKDAPEGQATGSTESEVPTLHTKKSRTFGRSKKQEPEPMPEPEFDVANALPPTDDFRTSLLMSGLSARFSMLREQDDPNSKIGKASDDSVLFPKQGTKFNEFDFQRPYGLSDIAEVASINGSIRPPFADRERNDSYSTLTGSVADDDSVHSGSIMSRAKPGEGNNLFGGRQKIYKLPANSSASTKSLGEGGNMPGRAVYDHDVSQSAFQKLREREKERERVAREESEAAQQSSRPPSPPLSGYNRNRETSSTTSSAHGNVRISTAATSVTSQRTPSLKGDHTPITPNGSINGNLERSTTKTRRLYETGLDQHLHEQQHSAMNRIDTLSRQRNIGTRTPPMNSPTGSFPSDRWDRQVLSKQSMPNLRPTSPVQSNTGLNGFDFAVKPANPPDSKAYGISSPPLSPPPGQGETVLLPVRPNDRGKATATGAFSRPSEPYDEHKYSQRQVQMQQGRETPPLRKHSPPDVFIPRPQGGRSRANSNATFASSGSGRSGSNSSANRHFHPQRVSETQPTTVPENNAVKGIFLTSPEDVDMPTTEDQPLRSQGSALDLSKMNFQDQNVNLERPPESQHPANRQKIAESSVVPKDGSLDSPRSGDGLLTPDFNKPSLNLPADSPTLGPTSGTTGLSGMVRQHLRSDSNTSSVYGGASSGALTSRFPTEINQPLPQDYYSQSNPWDGDDGWDRDYYTSQSSAELPKEPKDLDALPSPLAVRSPNVEKRNDGVKSAWERELESHHTRDGSTETQKERLDFKNELAERRRRVQENMKSFVEADSRSASPLPDLPSKSNPLGLLKSKSSRGSLVVRSKEPPQLKAMKMLGLGSATITSSPSPNHAEFDSEIHRNYEDHPVNGGQVRRPNPPPENRSFRQARRDAQHDRERQTAIRHQGQGREGHNPQWRPENRSPQPGNMNHRGPPGARPRQRTPSKERPPQVMTRPSRNGTMESQNSGPSSRSDSSPSSRPSRDRSGSDNSQNRSKSRNGRYRDDLARDGAASNDQAHYNDLQLPAIPMAPRSPGGLPSGPSPIPSPMMPPGGRSRSNSRPAPIPNEHAESQRTLAPIKIHDGPYGLPLSPRPSPTALFSVNQTPAQPSPGMPPAVTPTVAAFQPQPHVPTVRKMSVNKSQISEPKFVSSTSRVTTINLSQVSQQNLQNGMPVIGAPPIPPVNPARRQPRGMFGLRRKDDYEEVQPMPQATQSTEEMSTFSDDGEPKSRNRQKLRKVSSEGGNLNAKARQAASAKPSPAMPTTTAFTAPRGNSPPRPPPSEGGMF
ncbi:hypothetical protein GLAREA_00206 [Glarea lozoyensis ATCC 20868]|uniref:Uncharacterized protein n=1 Tax=Glarea lozoyensis (strain ATCC 20868 / MF5171) TaxID=1116229 RepID=S3DRE8_GLAL2|nr:uncharacterized protein GLAREA_00206 [Glarea lozoyensis ATCC 20868]EPE29048.1 hypothetical protein GLAREA_00206 [Glarea lozoyensis ATCC 20868]